MHRHRPAPCTPADSGGKASRKQSHQGLREVCQQMWLARPSHGRHQLWKQ